MGKMKSTFTPRRGDVNTIQEQPMEMYTQIECATEPLDQPNRTGLHAVSGESRFLDLLSRDGR